MNLPGSIREQLPRGASLYGGAMGPGRARLAARGRPGGGKTMPSVGARKRKPVMSDVAAAQAVSLPSPSQPPAPARASASSFAAPAATPAPVPAKPRVDPAASALSAQLANLPVFAELAPDRLHALVLEARAVDLPAGGVLFHQGDASQSLYVVVEGAVVPIAEAAPRGAEGGARRKLAVLERGNLVGEIGLVTRQPRNATVVALVDSKLVAIDRDALLPVLRASRALAGHVLAPVRRRMLDRQLRTNLFFAAFAPPAREAIARQFRLVEVMPGTKLVRQGEPPEALFLVLAGTLARRDPRRGRALARLGIGDLFGGRALLDGTASDCDVVATGRAWVLVLGEGRFRRLVEAHPRLVRVVRRLADDAAEGADASPDSGAMPEDPTNAPAPPRRPRRAPPRPASAPRADAAGRAPGSRS